MSKSKFYSHERNVTDTQLEAVTKIGNGYVVPNASLTIPINLTISLGLPAYQAGPQLPPQRPLPFSNGGLLANPSNAPAGLPYSTHNYEPPMYSLEGYKVPFVDRNYETREGYDSGFLGGQKVELPEISEESVLAKMISGRDEGDYVIPYENFSIVMHKYRRMAIFTAANVDLAPDKRKPDRTKKYTRSALTGLKRGDSEKWITDPRIADKHQLPDLFYKEDRKSFDKGHLVRRHAVCWGDDYDHVKRANGDTFHTTNCSPQVLHFNRSTRNGLWGHLENFIFNSLEEDKTRACIFSGPVFSDDDPLFDGISPEGFIQVQIPQSYWKLVVVNEKSILKSYAFILDQDLDSVDFRAESFLAEELVISDDWILHTISIEELEDILEIIEFPESVRRADQYETVIKRDDLMENYIASN